MRFFSQHINTIFLLFIALALGAIAMQLALNATPRSSEPVVVYIDPEGGRQQAQQQPTQTIPPYTPFASWTPTRTLKPPPTFEPPTPTRQPSATPSATPTATLDLSISVEGLRGIETPTPSSGAAADCSVRDDWSGQHTVQRNQALTQIAAQYNTSVEILVAGNCLANANLIVEGQVLRIPGTGQGLDPAPSARTAGGVSIPPSAPAPAVGSGGAFPGIQESACLPFEALTPFDGSQTVPGDGELTFNWRGTQGTRNLLRVIRPDGSMYEQVVELRQNATVDNYKNLPMAGEYRWYVYPLDVNFQQFCPEGGPWRFVKSAAATQTPTVTPTIEQVVASFVVLKNTPPDLTVQLVNTSKATGAGTPFVYFTWTFNNNLPTTYGEQPFYTFPAAGQYLVTLTISNDAGTKHTTQQVVTVP